MLGSNRTKERDKNWCLISSEEVSKGDFNRTRDICHWKSDDFFIVNND